MGGGDVTKDKMDYELQKIRWTKVQFGLARGPNQVQFELSQAQFDANLYHRLTFKDDASVLY